VLPQVVVKVVVLLKMLRLLSLFLARHSLGSATAITYELSLARRAACGRHAPVKATGVWKGCSSNININTSITPDSGF
jgi:hypothetical protein